MCEGGGGGRVKRPSSPHTQVCRVGQAVRCPPPPPLSPALVTLPGRALALVPCAPGRRGAGHACTRQAAPPGPTGGSQHPHDCPPLLPSSSWPAPACKTQSSGRTCREASKGGWCGGEAVVRGGTHVWGVGGRRVAWGTRAGGELMGGGSRDQVIGGGRRRNHPSCRHLPPALQASAPHRSSAARLRTQRRRRGGAPTHTHPTRSAPSRRFFPPCL